MKTFRQYIDEIDNWMKNPVVIEEFKQRYGEDWEDMMIYLSNVKEKSLDEKK